MSGRLVTAHRHIPSRMPRDLGSPHDDTGVPADLMGSPRWTPEQETAARALVRRRAVDETDRADLLAMLFGGAR